jgi:hypothetical protein
MAILIYVIIIEIQKKMYFNSKIGNICKGGFGYPEFRVISIKKDADSDSNTIARYEVECYFYSKENLKGFIYQRYYFYDKVDMYKIGDILTLTKKY